MSISIAILRRLLRVLAIFLLGQPPDLQIFDDLVPRLSSNTFQPFCIPTSMYSESAYRAKFAKCILGAKYRLSREQHVAKEKILQPPGLQPFWLTSPFEPKVDPLAKLHFITAVLHSYSMSCLAVISHLAVHRRSHACPIRQIITGSLPLIFIPNRIWSPYLTTLSCFSPTSQLLAQLAPLLHLRDNLPLVSLQRPSESSSSP